MRLLEGRDILWCWVLSPFLRTGVWKRSREEVSPFFSLRICFGYTSAKHRVLSAQLLEKCTLLESAHVDVNHRALQTDVTKDAR